jgi:hypothetical protein
VNQKGLNDFHSGHSRVSPPQVRYTADTTRAMQQVYRLYQRWDRPKGRIGNLVVVSFLVVQGLDGALTYLGLRMWGPAVEANPLVSSAIAFAGPGAGVVGAKAVAAALGMMLHLRRVHDVVAMLTLVYVTMAIIPWTALFVMAR